MENNKLICIISKPKKKLKNPIESCKIHVLSLSTAVEQPASFTSVYSVPRVSSKSSASCLSFSSRTPVDMNVQADYTYKAGHETASGR